MYKCECGKEFEKKQALCGHCGHCKIHLSEERYQHNLNLDLLHQKVAAETTKLLGKLREEQRINQWIVDEHKCLNCGQVIKKYYGSGIFCCETCARSWSGSQTNDSYSRRVKSLAIGRQTHINNIKSGLYKPKLLSEATKLKISKSVKKTMSDPEIRKRISDKLTGRTLSIETRAKISEKVRLSHLEGRNKGWTTRRNLESYAETFWRHVLENNNIEYKQEFKVNKPGPGCYFLDFLLPGNVDLEIDGHQHYEENRKIGDQIRDSYLKSIGYVVYRIKWVNPKNSLKVQEDISKFLSWYQEISQGGAIGSLPGS